MADEVTGPTYDPNGPPDPRGGTFKESADSKGWDFHPFGGDPIPVVWDEGTAGGPIHGADPSRVRQAALGLADQCEQAADTLAAEATDLAGQDDEVSVFRQQMKTEAAETARSYAAGLRERADHATDADIKQAELVADTAQLGGFTIDSSGMDGHDPVKVQAQQDLVAAGLAERVAEPGQVPFYRLTGNAQANADEVASAAATVAELEDTDEA